VPTLLLTTFLKKKNKSNQIKNYVRVEEASFLDHQSQLKPFPFLPESVCFRGFKNKINFLKLIFNF
jgi:hypothetical protein